MCGWYMAQRWYLLLPAGQLLVHNYLIHSPDIEIEMLTQFYHEDDIQNMATSDWKRVFSLRDDYLLVYTSS